MRICNEQDAIDFLHKCWSDPAYGSDLPIELESCAIRLRYEPGDGTADKKTLRAVALLQRHLELVYLLAKNGAPSGSVSSPESDLLSLVTTVRPGSKLLKLESVRALRAIYKALPAHWSTRTRNIIITGICASVLVSPYAAMYTYYRTAVDEAGLLGRPDVSSG